MAMTPDQMIDFFRHQASRATHGLNVAEASSNYELAAFNSRQWFKARLMQGLVTWRQRKDPSEFLAEAFRSYTNGWEVLTRIRAEGAKRSDIPSEKVGYVAYLLDQPVQNVEPNGLEAERLLDAVLVNSFSGVWDAEQWEVGMGQLRSIGSDLAVDTYVLYEQIARSEPSQLESLLQRGSELFTRRAHDEYFSGGDQTEGGGPDNDVTVDYRLASLLNRQGFKGEGLHVWRW